MDLLTALRASGAGAFADKVEKNDHLRALYLSTDIKTVFAPVDNVSSDASLAYIGALQYEEDPQNLLGASFNLSSLSSTATGVPLDVASQELKGNNEKNHLVLVLGRKPPAARVKRNQTFDTPETQLEVISGLGDKVSVVSSYIDYDGGYLHTIDG